MESISTLMILAIAFAGVAGCAIAQFAYYCAHDLGRAATMLSPTFASRITFQLQRGVPFIDERSKVLIERLPLVAEASERVKLALAEKGNIYKQETLVSLLLTASLLVGIIGAIIMRSAVFGVAIAIILLIAVLSYIKNRGEKRDVEMREELPDAIRSIEMSFRSGHSLTQTLENSSKECSGYLGKLFASSVDRLEMGATTTEALSMLCGNKHIPELSFVAVALDIQHHSGGSIAPVLESAMDAIESELNLMRKLRVQTAQAKLSATIVTVMPFMLVALFSMMSPDFLTPFFSSILGIIMLAVALCMQFAGVMIVRRMLKVDRS